MDFLSEATTNREQFLLIHVVWLIYCNECPLGTVCVLFVHRVCAILVVQSGFPYSKGIPRASSLCVFPFSSVSILFSCFLFSGNKRECFPSIHVAVRHANVTCVSILLANGASEYDRDCQGRTPMEVCMHVHNHMLDWLSVNLIDRIVYLCRWFVRWLTCC